MNDSEKDYRLINACFESLEEADKLLTAEPSLLEARVVTGETAFHYLVIENQIDAARFLLGRGADINTQDDSKVTPLAHAALCGYVEMVEYLLSQGADLNLVDENMDTPIHHAAHGDNPEVVMVLVKAGADVNSANDLEETPLHIAVAKDDRVEVSRMLVENGADIEIKDMVDETPLHKASFWGSLRQCEYLISCGADPKTKNVDGYTPYDIAEWQEQMEIVKFLNKA